jgi:hypothetical protein
MTKKKKAYARAGVHVDPNLTADCADQNGLQGGSAAPRAMLKKMRLRRHYRIEQVVDLRSRRAEFQLFWRWVQSRGL